MNAILEQAGISENLRACWLGHTVQVNKSSYVRPASDWRPSVTRSAGFSSPCDKSVTKPGPEA